MKSGKGETVSVTRRKILNYLHTKALCITLKHYDIIKKKEFLLTQLLSKYVQFQIFFFNELGYCFAIH